MEGSAYHYTTMTHISVNVNQMAVGSVEANIARMFSVSNAVYFSQKINGRTLQRYIFQNAKSVDNNLKICYDGRGESYLKCFM